MGWDGDAAQGTSRDMKTRVHNRIRIAFALGMFVWLSLLIPAMSWAKSVGSHIEKKIQDYIRSENFLTFQDDRRCRDAARYRVYLIDSFEQAILLVPEVRTSHGELLVKLLKTGRDDIEVVILNTSLSRGLAQVIQDLLDGACADAVVSSIPGSNYTYDQISSLFPGREPIVPETILYHRSALRQLLRQIAFHGFPSVQWLQNVDVNSVKLRNDARKFVFIEALGRFKVPVVLPYGNPDAPYKGRIKSVNLLSLAANARVYSALDQNGERLQGFPYSPLSSGDEPAVYPITECPHPTDPFKAMLDINNDGYSDYTFFRTGTIPFRNDEGQLAFAPPVIPQHLFAKWRQRIESDADCQIDDDLVLTIDQYTTLKLLCPNAFRQIISKPYVWLNSTQHGRIYEFQAECRDRGTISGTSLIPPNKLQDLLPPKQSQAPMPRKGAGPLPAGG